jgi:cytoskeletal protein CcmA (bactofilin family)
MENGNGLQLCEDGVQRWSEAMIWEKKARQNEPKNSEPISTPSAALGEAPATPALPEPSKLENPMAETTQKVTTSLPPSQGQTTVGRSVNLKGELSGNEDLLIEGQFEGNINVQDHCLTVGAQGQVKAEIQARQVIVFGKVDGKINARDKIELRKTGYVIGDLTSMGIAIEEGAYFKGSIEILREAPTKAELPRVASAVSAVAAKAVN